MEYRNVFLTFGLIPTKVFAFENLYTFVTYMFIHSDPFHLFGNMLFLFIFGNFCEPSTGHLRFLAIYVASGMLGVFPHLLFFSTSNVPCVGASGAIFGIIGAYPVLFPLKPSGPRHAIIPPIVGIPAFVLFATLVSLYNPSIGVLIHIGGFITGLAATRIMFPQTEGLLWAFVESLAGILIPDTEEEESD